MNKKIKSGFLFIGLFVPMLVGFVCLVVGACLSAVGWLMIGEWRSALRVLKKFDQE